MERQKELQAFAHTWKGKPRQQVVEEILSYSHETKRIPDPYKFLFRDDKLISPITGEPIENSIDTSSPIARKEAMALINIQDWTKDNDSGVSVWISPPHHERSQDTKIVVSEIFFEQNEKILLNRALIFGMDGQACVDAANSLPHRSQEQDLSNPEALREQPIFLDLPEKLGAVEILRAHFHDPLQWEMVAEGTDVVIKEKSRPAAEKYYQEKFGKPLGMPQVIYSQKPFHELNKSLRNQLFGQYPGSCPPGLKQGSDRRGAFEIALQNSHPEGAKVLCCTCPFCRKEVEAPIKNGKIHCPKCGESAPWIE